jgi:hypothetical protein
MKISKKEYQQICCECAEMLLYSRTEETISQKDLLVIEKIIFGG